MEKLKSLEEFENLKSESKNIMFYIFDPNCGVTVGPRPLVKELSETTRVPVYEIDVSEVEGSVEKFKVERNPIVILFNKGEEVHRQIQYIDLRELRDVIMEYK